MASGCLISDSSCHYPSADDALFSAAYDELKRIARRHLRVRAANATLNTTELVHEAFFKLTPVHGAGWEDRAHFFGAASRAMRQVLVDFARRRTATKRGGSFSRVALSDEAGALEFEFDQILAVDTALLQLDLVSQRLRQVVELRFFAGLSNEEVARMLDVSPRTVERDWMKARLFLLRELEASGQQSMNGGTRT